ncbi:MAG: DNA primase [Treponema sp.]|jgi:DNA primase|nr:DNA primase [Treponema sp.]
MPLIAKSTIDEVSSRMDALAVVGDYVRLEKRSGRWWGLCPFHQEKTGSFTVDPDRKTYYCFGCHKGGSVLSFVMEMDKLAFPEAVEILAKRFGVEITYENSLGGQVPAGDEEASRKKEELFELYRRMAGTFHHFLLEKSEGAPAKQYIISRGLNNDMIEQFRLGYAPEDRRWLYPFLLHKGYSGDFLGASGLFSSRHEGAPLFAGRLMFPIVDRQGRVVAFGGRILEGAGSGGREPPKYINSPETGIYKKGETLFAIDLAIPEIRRTKTVHIAEGYMDVIALHQAGVSNSVAPLGTAFTDGQARLLRRWAEKAILVFDSDRAGQEAAVKGILTCRRNGLSSAVVVPGGGNGAEMKDPADILKVYGPEALQKRIKWVINDFDFLVSRAKSLFDISASEGKAKAAAFLFPYLEALDSEVSRDACIEAAAAAFGTARTAIENDLRRFGPDGQGKGRGVAREENPRQRSGGAPIRLSDELFLLMAVAANDMAGGKERLYPEFRKTLKINELEDPAAKELFVALEECFVHDETGVDQFLARISSQELKDFYLQRGSSGEFAINPGQFLADCRNMTAGKKLKHRRDEIVAKLQGLKRKEGNTGETDELLAEKMEIDRELLRLKEDSR